MIIIAMRLMLLVFSSVKAILAIESAWKIGSVIILKLKKNRNFYFENVHLPVHAMKKDVLLVVKIVRVLFVNAKSQKTIYM